MNMFEVLPKFFSHFGWSCLKSRKMNFSNFSLYPYRNINGSAYEHKHLKTMKLIKLTFSTLLFGGTLVAAFYLKKRHQKELSEIFKDCTVLPKDTKYHRNMIHYRFKNYVLPKFVIENMKSIQNFEVKEDDIFVVAFPKTGITWLQEIVYCISTDLDFETAKKVNIEDRFPYLEFLYPGVAAVSKMPSPRFIKTHLPYSLLPPQMKEKCPKILYVMRNPKDVVVSYYHFACMLTMSHYTGSFEDFFESFIKDKVMYGPIWRHYLEFWEQRNKDNIFIITYEELKKDIKGSIRRIAEFLGKELSEDEIIKLSEHCLFENMADNTSVNYKHWDDLGIRDKTKEKFMRKGIVGDWKNYFTVDMNKKMEKYIEDHFTNHGIYFNFTLESQ